MYMREPSEEALALCFCAAAVLFLGIFPNEGSLPFVGLELPVLDWAGESVKQFFGP